MIWITIQLFIQLVKWNLLNRILNSISYNSLVNNLCIAFPATHTYLHILTQTHAHAQQIIFGIVKKQSLHSVQLSICITFRFFSMLFPWFSTHFYFLSVFIGIQCKMRNLMKLCIISKNFSIVKVQSMRCDCCIIKIVFKNITCSIKLGFCILADRCRKVISEWIDFIYFYNLIKVSFPMD